MKADENRITLGRVGRTHGVNGWVRLYSFTDPASNLADYRHVLICKGSREEQGEIDEVLTRGDHLVAHFVGYDTPGASQSLVGAELTVSSDVLPALGPDEFYWHQLLGLTVINRQGQLLGRVSRMLETGANDVLVVQPCKDSIDGHERLIPYLRGSVVFGVDLEKGTIGVDWSADFLL